MSFAFDVAQQMEFLSQVYYQTRLAGGAVPLAAQELEAVLGKFQHYRRAEKKEAGRVPAAGLLVGTALSFRKVPAGGTASQLQRSAQYFSISLKINSL